MKMNLFMMAFAVIFTVVLSSCSGNKSKAEKSSVDKAQVTATETVSDKESVADSDNPFKGVDVEGINALADKKELTAKDYDFLLDQIAIFAKNTKGMSKKEQKQIMKNISEKELVALLGMSSLKKAMEKGKLTEKQVERFKKIEAMNPDI